MDIDSWLVWVWNLVQLILVRLPCQSTGFASSYFSLAESVLLGFSTDLEITCLITDVLSPLLFAWFWAWASNHLNIGVKFWESMTPPFQTIFSLFLVTSEIRKELYTKFGHTNPVNPYSSRISSNYIWTDFLWNLRYVDNAKSGVWP